MPNWMIALAALVLVVLSTVAIYYHVRLYQQLKKQALAEKDLENILNERKARNINSIVVIARAVLDDQVSLTEASIRINALAPTLGLNDSVLEELRVFRQLSEATAHIPILDKWKALSKKEKASFTQERESIESKFADFIKHAAKKIVNKEIDLS